MEENRDIKKLHVLTNIIMFMVFLIIIFSNDNPIIVFSFYLFILGTMIYTGNLHKIKNGILYFLPFAALIIIINLVFVTQGNIVMFHIGSRKITLESLIYAVILSMKFLAVLYLFMVFELCIDSDKSISYFSSKLPKSTLTLVLIFKLIPAMKEKFYSLKNTYAVRGVEFQEAKGKDKIKKYIPVMSVLLEESMESSFNIGEAAYVRGFLSTKRSVYDRQDFNIKDKVILAVIGILLIVYIIAQMKGLIDFQVYDGVTIKNIFNLGTVLILAIIASITWLVTLF